MTQLVINQRVPSWDLDDPTLTLPPFPPPFRPLALRPQINSNPLADDVSTTDYEIAELTWKNGQLGMHGFGPPRLLNKTAAISSSCSMWDKPPAAAGGTLESIVNQATTIPQGKSSVGRDELVPWSQESVRTVSNPAATANSITLNLDALVPCTNPAATGNIINHQKGYAQVLNTVPAGIKKCVVACSTRVASCSEAATLEKPGEARFPHEWTSRGDQSVDVSATCGQDSRQVTRDTYEREFGTAGFTSTSLGSPVNTSSAKQCTKTVDNDHDSVCHSRNLQKEARNEEDKKKGSGKLSVSTKRSRAAAIHNQSERKRRDKINERMKTLQKLVPNSSKTDKASMLDEVIEYLKQLQSQVQMMRGMNMSQMMLPLALQQQQLQMSMMSPVGLGMNMGMGLGMMDMNTMAARPNIAGISPVLHPTVFLPAVTSWDGSAGDRLTPSTSAIPDPLSAFLACQSQPMTMDAYSRMAALYQQFQQSSSGAASMSKPI